MGKINLVQLTDVEWEVKKEGRMKVDVRIYGSLELVQKMQQDKTIEQIINVSTLPGIVPYASVMPDGHEGYGFPIGGVAAFDREEDGIISPGGVGFDINCGVRLLRTELEEKDILAKKEKLAKEIFRLVPSGVGEKGKVRLEKHELKEAVENGLDWALKKGYASEKDLENCEENGQMKGARFEFVSQRAIDRGKNQLGTVGSGNHFIEIQKVEQIFDEYLAKKFGLRKHQILIMIHSGSRGFGHQICSDYVQEMLKASKKYKIDLPDPQLCCAPIDSIEGERYLGAMKCAINYAFNNRQLIMYWIKEAFDNVIGPKTSESMEMIYDVCHNIAKMEKHKNRELCVHRKGATRAFAAGTEVLSAKYREIGQPVIIPGSMGSASYLLVGQNGAMEKTFGSTCHGAGRNLSRAAAKKSLPQREVIKNLENQNIVLLATEMGLISEEAPQAYKDIDKVIESVQKAGLSKAVVRLKPIIVLKG
ncbi:MAG: RtcB family protein [Candidatus Micrarchaeota archaeon]|nr:RtcB family protein [Candidatus Micrarchaeota archaeon]